MIKKLINNYLKTAKDMSNEEYSMDAKLLLYSKIVLMQLIRITGGEDRETKRIMDYVREAEREDGLDLSIYYKDLMFLDNILDRDCGIAEFYNINIETCDKLEDRLSNLIDCLNSKELPERGVNKRLTIAEIRRLNKQADNLRYDIINPFSNEDKQEDNHKVVEPKEIKNKEPETLDDVEVCHIDNSFKTGDKVIDVNLPGNIEDLLVRVFETRLKDMTATFEVNLKSSIDIVQDTVKEANATITNTVSEVNKAMEDNLSVIDKKMEDHTKLLSDMEKTITESVTKSARTLNDIIVPSTSPMSEPVTGSTKNTTSLFEDAPLDDISNEEGSFDAFEDDSIVDKQPAFPDMEINETTFDVFNENIIEDEDN